MRNALTLLRNWFVATRPHTLSAGVVPVLVGTAVAVSGGAFEGHLLALVLVASILVQIGANLTDEFADHDATASARKYLAPHKVIKRGLLSAGAVRWGAVVAFGAATLIGVYLVWRTGWPLLVVCLVSLGVAYGYSAGPFPLGHAALGEALVFVVMGPLMVGATEYVQRGAVSGEGLWLSLSVAALVTAILVVNNLRDEAEDRAHGRRTTVTLFGALRVRAVYLVLVVAAFLVPLGPLALGLRTGWMFLPWFTLPLAAIVTRRVLISTDRDLLHFCLRATSVLHLLFGLLLALAVLGDWAFRGTP
ncbi:MAG: 1,4-dihydroxy-2-naphthoate octaprenyltransferase [Candidatus Lambdaproteobacteria bacterium]|nr:1,4-dihydroxy-2-naphthoate octaprenyltransferase [Candidatus Lambdaproteobacteria bacterium]